MLTFLPPPVVLPVLGAPLSDSCVTLPVLIYRSVVL